MEWSAIANLAIGILGGGGALIALVAFLMRLDAKVGRIDKNVKFLVSTVDKLVDHIHDAPSGAKLLDHFERFLLQCLRGTDGEVRNHEQSRFRGHDYLPFSGWPTQQSTAARR